MIVVSGRPHGLEWVERPTLGWRGCDSGRGALALGSFISLLAKWLTGMLRLGSMLVTVVFGTGTVRFGDVKQVV